jgi:hypothetical protein
MCVVQTRNIYRTEGHTEFSSVDSSLLVNLMILDVSTRITMQNKAFTEGTKESEMCFKLLFQTGPEKVMTTPISQRSMPKSKRQQLICRERPFPSIVMLYSSQPKTLPTLQS